MRKRPFKSMMLVPLILAAAISVAGQVRTGEIHIDVRDPAGNAMEAAGKLVGLATELDRPFATDAQGSYTFGMLPYGRYRIEVSRDGFVTQTTLIDVQSETVSRTVTMAVG